MLRFLADESGDFAAVRALGMMASTSYRLQRLFRALTMNV